MARPTKQCAKCGLLEAVELERFDMSYKNHPVTVVDKPVKKVVDKPVSKPQTDDLRDKLMFNAGRYAGGATDDVALLAHLKLQQLLDN
jgi:hypothetical protein